MLRKLTARDAMGTKRTRFSLTAKNAKARRQILRGIPGDHEGEGAKMRIGD
jgi:hypothetical protein